MLSNQKKTIEELREKLIKAMGNAPDEVKAVADHITLDVEHNGVAAAIERFLV